MSQPFLLDHLSAKNLGSLAMPDFCPRCYWAKARMSFNGPWNSFPSIFSNIDIYSKKVTEAHIKAHANLAPSWLMQFGNIVGQLPCPHWSKFSFTDPATNVKLRGSPDERFQMADDTVAILDYKTARFTEHQDELLPIYTVQLGVYQWLTLKLEHKETSVTGLVYYEPPTKEEMESFDPDKILTDGFLMKFKAHILPVQTDLAQVESLLAEAQRIVQSNDPPAGKVGCKDCQKIDHIRQMFV